MGFRDCIRLLVLLLPALPVQAGNAIELRLTPRTPEQMAAFYEARGFPRAMVERLKQPCFVTVRIRNRGDEVVWLDLADWHFSAGGRPLRRYHRDEWMRTWERLQVPMASRATFRWTLLPERLDFQPDEAEGGNILLQRVPGPITLDATFATGADRRGPVLKIHRDNIECASDPA